MNQGGEASCLPARVDGDVPRSNVADGLKFRRNNLPFMGDLLKDSLRILRSRDFVHSVILFGSRARGDEEPGSDIDLCVVEEPGAEVSLKERLRLETDLPGEVDLSFYGELPPNVRRRILREGEIVYTRDPLYVYELIKILDLEYPRYRDFLERYHESVMEKVRRKVET